MGRQPCCERVGLKRGPWTMEEDAKLMNFILNNGIQCWRLVPKLAGLMRCGKSCRLRWINYLRPDLKRGAFTEAEENMIIELHSRLGNRWSKIATHFPGRTDNEIKNQWNTRIKKKMKLMGLDPLTHEPIVQKPQTSTAENDQELHHNLEFQESVTIPPPKDYQPICGTNQHKIDDYNIKNLEMRSSIMFHNKESMGNFNFPNMDQFQNWIDNPFLWDSFTSFGDSFPRIN